ncbi:MAG: PD-(D/E)XK nuclease family protein, partial [Lachnospiraceae bacterium]|nr:PD-(D/E)XK nuclease family protein [Lachnospiraceae bacterium]
KEETTIRNVVKATAMTGIVNEDENCRSYMGDPDILPGPDEELGKYSDLLEEVQDTVKNLGEDILGGKIPIRPVKAGRGLPCDYCDYRDVCKLDVKDGGNRVITAKQLMKDRKMEQTAAGNKG